MKKLKNVWRCMMLTTRSIKSSDNWPTPQIMGNNSNAEQPPIKKAKTEYNGFIAGRVTKNLHTHHLFRTTRFRYINDIFEEKKVKFF